MLRRKDQFLANAPLLGAARSRTHSDVVALSSDDESHGNTVRGCNSPAQQAGRFGPPTDPSRRLAAERPTDRNGFSLATLCDTSSYERSTEELPSDVGAHSVPVGRPSSGRKNRPGGPSPVDTLLSAPQLNTETVPKRTVICLRKTTSQKPLGEHKTKDHPADHHFFIPPKAFRPCRSSKQTRQARPFVSIMTVGRRAALSARRQVSAR